MGCNLQMTSAKMPVVVSKAQQRLLNKYCLEEKLLLGYRVSWHYCTEKNQESPLGVLKSLQMLRLRPLEDISTLLNRTQIIRPAQTHQARVS